MKAFRVIVDGKPLGDLGVADSNNASVIVSLGRASDAEPFDYRIWVGGLTQPDESGVARHYRWACPEIEEGARLEIELVDSENCVPPTKLYRSDHVVQERAYTDEEMRKMRYEDYLRLKKEFEP